MKKILVEKELLQQRKGFAEVEVFYGANNKAYNFKPSDKEAKISVFIDDLIGLTLTEDLTLEQYILSYNDGAYVFEKNVSTGLDFSVEELKKQGIIMYNELCKRSSQIVDGKYVKKKLFGLEYL